MSILAASVTKQVVLYGQALNTEGQYRLLAFWDKRDSSETLVIATNGFIKKTKKTPKSEINRARQIMEFYFKTT